MWLEHPVKRSVPVNFSHRQPPRGAGVELTVCAVTDHIGLKLLAKATYISVTGANGPRKCQHYRAKQVTILATFAVLQHLLCWLYFRNEVNWRLRTNNPSILYLLSKWSTPLYEVINKKVFFFLFFFFLFLINTLISNSILIQLKLKLI